MKRTEFDNGQRLTLSTSKGITFSNDTKPVEPAKVTLEEVVEVVL